MIKAYQTITIFTNGEKFQRSEFDGYTHELTLTAENSPTGQDMT